MSPERQSAYRHLLYVAMIDIRTYCQWRDQESTDPERWRKQYLASRKAGAIADWLHNLAQHGATDFAGFDEDEFWKSCDGVKELSGTKQYYQLHFDRRLKELE